MADTGYLFPTSATQDSSGTDAWTGTGNLAADDASAATVQLRSGDVSNTLSLGFNLASIPDSATIIGIEVIAEVQGTTGTGGVTSAANIQINGGTAKDGVAIGSSTAWTVQTFGGPTDTWGMSAASLTGAGFKSNFAFSFKAAASAGGSGQAAYDVDYVKIRVYYTDPISGFKVFVNNEWTYKPIKVFLDGQWVAKPLKRWNGTDWVLVVAPTPDTTPPTITTADTKNVLEGNTLSIALAADEDVTWAIVGGTDQSAFEIIGTTLRWAGNGVKDYEAPTDGGSNNSYIVTIRATDAAGNSTDKTITVTVTNNTADDPADTTAPTITTAATKSVQENSTLSIALTADEAVSWAIVGGTDSTSFEISGTTLRWKSNGTKDYENPTDGGANNTYIVTIRATDAANNSTDKTITVTVTNSTADDGPTAATYTPAPGTYSKDDAGSGTEVIFSITASRSVVWTYSSTNTGAFHATANVASGGSATSITFTLPTRINSSNADTVTVQANDGVSTKTWTLNLSNAIAGGGM